MKISLNSQINKWIAEKVNSGFCNSASEVVLEGLRLLKIQEEQRQAMTEDLRREILIGVKQLDAGKSACFDESVVAEIKNSARSKIIS
jgi:putative addiction module CopG family antidote